MGTNIQQQAEAREQRAKVDRLHLLGPERAAEELGRYCAYCGTLQVPRVERYELPWLREPRPAFIWPDRCGCAAEERALVEAKERGEKRTLDERRREREKRLDDAGLVGWMRGATFDTFLPRPEWPDAEEKKRAVYQYTELMLGGALGDKTFLLLFGDYGTGKSHLAAATARAALDAGWRGVRFCDWTRWTERVKESWNGDRDTGSLHADLREGHFVVIDDLDKKRPTDWTREVLYPIINHRYNVAAFTVLTFNVGPGDADEDAPGRLAIEQYLGRAVLDRVMERAFLAVEFSGPSYRSGARVPAQEKNPWYWYNGRNE